MGDTWRELEVRGAGGVLGAWSDGERAWLMYTADDDAGCFTSRAPDGHPAAAGERSFVLANGQRDEVPEAWTVPADLAVEALDEFARNGRLLRTIDWVDEFAGTLGPGDLGL